MMTADLALGGHKKHVILQPSKNGFFYVLEAATGKLISADPFTEVNWATGVDMKTGRPDVVPGARYEKEPWNLAPGVQGGHSWHPNAFSPETGLVYIPSWDAYFTMAGVPPGSGPPPGGFSLGINMGVKVEPGKLQPYDRHGVSGRLKAWDPVARKVVWETEPYSEGLPTSGVLATAGNLVFMGNGVGKVLSAYDAKSGAKLWSFDAKTAVVCRTDHLRARRCSIHRRQRRWSRAGRLLRTNSCTDVGFCTGWQDNATGTRVLHATAAQPAAFNRLGSDRCARWRSIYTVLLGLPRRQRFAGANQLPQPHRHATVVGHRKASTRSCCRGEGADKGMGSFGKDLKPEDTAAVREYLISRANVLKEGG